MEKILKAHQVIEARLVKHRAKQLIKEFQKNGITKLLSDQQFLNTVVKMARADVEKFGKKALTTERI